MKKTKTKTRGQNWHFKKNNGSVRDQFVKKRQFRGLYENLRGLYENTHSSETYLEFLEVKNLFESGRQFRGLFGEFTIFTFIDIFSYENRLCNICSDIIMYKFVYLTLRSKCSSILFLKSILLFVHYNWILNMFIKLYIVTLALKYLHNYIYSYVFSLHKVKLLHSTP